MTAAGTPNRAHDPRVSCDSCGRWTGLDTGCCGECAEDYNARNRHEGRARINRRRERNGLPPLDTPREAS